MQLFISINLFATKYISIGLFKDYNIKSIIISPSEGSYEISGEGQIIYLLEKKDAIVVNNYGGGLQIRTLNKDLGHYAKITLKKKEETSSFKIKTLVPETEERIYTDNVTIKPTASNLKVINTVEIESYIAGVVESEAGTKQSYEYYKVQSIICRTYALNNLRKHADEGYQLCDGTHCQVYFNKNRYNSNISSATEATNGLVIVDSDINIITAAFHSNCGGQTINSEDVWKYSLPYLKSVCDTFCTGQPHAYWQKKIHLENWINYLEVKHRYPVRDSTYLSYVLNYIPADRNPLLLNSDIPLLLKEFRKDLGLQSTFFSINVTNGDSIVISGNGYGHGVGLCQEGAMKMAETGYSFDKILKYYYSNIHLVDLSLLDFFKD